MNQTVQSLRIIACTQLLCVQLGVLMRGWCGGAVMQSRCGIVYIKAKRAVAALRDCVFY